MPPTPPMPPVPVSTFWKNVPHYMQVLGTALIPFGAWVQSNVLTDPIFVQDFGSMANLPGIITMLSGILLNIASVFVVKSNNKAIDEHLVHTDVKIEEAAKAPALVPPGQDPIKFRLRHALEEAVKRDRMADADLILKVFPQLKGGAA